MGRLDIGDSEPALPRAWRGRREPLAEPDRGPGTWGCELDEAEPVERRNVIVEPPLLLAISRNSGSSAIRRFSQLTLLTGSIALGLAEFGHS